MENRSHSSARTLSSALIAGRTALQATEVRERKTALRILTLSLIALIVTLLPATAHAYPGGIAGYSGKSGQTCTACHSRGTASTVALNLPASVNSGATYSVTLTETAGAGSGGLDVASSAGTFAAGTGTQVLSGELVQSNGSSTHSWTFSWTAPTVTANTTATLYGAAMDSYGGNTGTVVANTTVVAAVTNPKMNLTPTSLAFSYQIGGAAPAAQTVAVSSSTTTAINYNSSTGVTVTVTSANGTGWAATANHNATTKTCGIYVGTATAPITGQNEGEPKCV